MPAALEMQITAEPKYVEQSFESRQHWLNAKNFSQIYTANEVKT